MAMAPHPAIYSVMLYFSLIALASSEQSMRFGYIGEMGPSHWGNLSPDFAMCSKGKHQSPINIEKKHVVYNPKLEPLQMHYVTSNATLVDNQINVLVRYNNSMDFIKADGKKYTLKQMHWHSPSEHTIDGERFDVELHMVHKNDEGNITVVAILYRYGRHDPFLDKIKSKVDEFAKAVHTSGEQAQIQIGQVHMTPLRRHCHKYFRYAGSLTTPPCTENITWHILLKVREMSRGQADELRSILEKGCRKNSRPTQPLHDRIVEMFDDTRAPRKKD
ncbi:alpha carbonic anhydrase 1 [Carex littledalei]|uniref:Carbonic anhydrase n=1 Tax=Carex littledalei TaxID=544730 RepID=A0A833QEK6_9POAL|nr:alpha carbonic anhydrase 1 [Carex littledalei]